MKNIFQISTQAYQYSDFSDTNSEIPIPVEVEQKTTVYEDHYEQDLIIIEYTINNNSNE